MPINYGLEKKELGLLGALFARYPDIEQVILYGSRAKGTNKPFSDVDITLTGERLVRSTLSRLLVDLDDLLLPYRFDVSIFHQLTNPDLVDHIRRRGIVIYYREGTSQKSEL
ncbi:MAG: nucleotidyltransferase domain-containing protein [Mediterranea sp.]|jgi:predicted nucleotidyltransferase|nr:nucleotidyltransferase domain-containing protein [Mediterranea sp.]